MNLRIDPGFLFRALRNSLVAGVLALMIVGAGQSFALAGDRTGGPVLALAAGADGSLFLKSDETGLFRSADEGKTWQQLPLQLADGASLTSVVAASGNAGVYYAAGREVGLMVSRDGGDTWASVEGNLPNTDIAALAAHSTQPDTLYGYLPESGIYRSKDAGETWKLMDKGPEGINQLIHTDMAGSMETGWLYAATDLGVRISMDCFCLWREASGIADATAAVAVNPQRAEELYAAAGKQLYRSVNGGQEWQVASSAPEAITALLVTGEGSVVAGTAGGRLFVLSFGADAWKQLND
jgi:photosystem II stability/assembly factor-like uncharacterized protein